MNSIKLIVYDFDGVMTNNKVYVDKDGNETVQVNRADGLGVAEIRKLGIQQMILSTETNPVVATRAQKLGIHCLQGIDNKVKALKKFCMYKKIAIKSVGYVGNDINDLEAMLLVAATFCPSDAHPDILKISTYVLKTKGGDGVVRELLDLLTNIGYNK